MQDHPYVFAGYASARSLPDITPAQARKLTHLNVAFGEVCDGIISIEHARPMFSYLKQIRAWNPDLYILLSTGGGNPAQKHLYGQATKDEAGVARIVSSAMDIVREFDLDGLDGDWERPLPEERDQYTAVLKGFRQELDKYELERGGRKCFVTIAAERIVEYLDCVDVPALADVLDYVFLMTYDARWDTGLTGHHCNTYARADDHMPVSCDWTVELFHDAGMPYEKLVIGAAFYSHRYNGVKGQGNGYAMPYEAYSYGPDYTAINLIYEKDSRFVKYWDDVCKEPWLFDGDSFLTYEDPQAMKYKCDYIKTKGIAGIMYWEHGCDKTGLLFNAIYDNLLL